MDNKVFSDGRSMDVENGLSSYISKVFGIMFIGLLVTAVVAFVTSFMIYNNNTVFNLLYNNSLIYVFIIVELVIVLSLSLRLAKIKYTTALFMFYLYAIVNGITLSGVLFMYSGATVYAAFFTTAASFGIMSIYGIVTKKDLTRIGNVFVMLLLGVIVASVVNLFLRNTLFDLVLSFIAVAIFVGLVAFDAQKLKHYYYLSINDYQMQKKLGVIGALSLYLDFVNIFLRLLRIFGNKRD